MSYTTRQRNRDFLNTCRQRLKCMRRDGRNPTLRHLVIDVLSRPAPCYYVDSYYANRVLIPALEDGLPDHKYSCRAMFGDMLRDLAELRRRHPSRPVRDLILELCCGLAGKPRFYISVRRALEIASPHFQSVITTE